jgi:hypothetical protein
MEPRRTTRRITRTMATARRPACPTPPAHAKRRHAHVVATSLAGALAGLAAGTAGGMWAPAVGRGVAPAAAPTITFSKLGGRRQAPASPSVAMVLAPATEAGIERTRRQDGRDGSP